MSLYAALLLMCCVVALVRPEFHNASYIAVALLIGAIFVERYLLVIIATVIVSERVSAKIRHAII